MEVQFNMQHYINVCEARRQRGLSVDDMCEKMVKECVYLPDDECSFLKLVNYIKEKNKQK